jgi:hypothetical protein
LGRTSRPLRAEAPAAALARVSERDAEMSTPACRRRIGGGGPGSQQSPASFRERGGPGRSRRSWPGARGS